MPERRGLFPAPAPPNVIAPAVYVLADFYRPLVIAPLLLGGGVGDKEEEEKWAIMSVWTSFFSSSRLLLSFHHRSSDPAESCVLTPT